MIRKLTFMAFALLAFASTAAAGGRDEHERLADLEERAAIRAVLDCYGHGHDTIFFHLGGDEREALDILRNCFTEDVHTTIVFFDSVAQKPLELSSLGALVDFIANNAIANHYRSARNVPGNVQIARTGPGRARVTSATAAPHFLRNDGNPASPANVDLITARYVNDVVLGRDGVWRTEKFTLIIDELWRGAGTYPLPR